jgi:hypothetical protein
VQVKSSRDKPKNNEFDKHGRNDNAYFSDESSAKASVSLRHPFTSDFPLGTYIIDTVNRFRLGLASNFTVYSCVFLFLVSMPTPDRFSVHAQNKNLPLRIQAERIRLFPLAVCLLKLYPHYSAFFAPDPPQTTTRVIMRVFCAIPSFYVVHRALEPTGKVRVS